LPASSCTTCAVAEILREGGVVLLHSSRGRCVAVAHRAVDHIKPTLPLIQPQLMVGLQGGVGEIHCAPFNVEDPVRRGPTHRGENTALAARIRGAASPAQIVRPLVVPVWVDAVVVGQPRQANIGEGRIRGRELGIAVGRYIDAGKRRVVQREWEGYCQISDYIVPVIAGICRSRYNTAPYLANRVLAGARCCRRGSCGGG